MSCQLPFRLLTWVPWAIAAMLIVTSAWFCQHYLETRTEVARLEDEQTLAAFETRMARNQLQAERLIANRQLADQEAIIARQVQQIDALADKTDITRFMIATFATPAGNGAETQAVAVWHPSTRQGILQVAKLPALDADQDYQLWVIDREDLVPVVGGVFSVDPATGDARVEFHLDKPVRTTAKFALSLERKGGAPKPKGPILLLSR